MSGANGRCVLNIGPHSPDGDPLTQVESMSCQLSLGLIPILLAGSRWAAFGFPNIVRSNRDLIVRRFGVMRPGEVARLAEHAVPDRSPLAQRLMGDVSRLLPRFRARTEHSFAEVIQLGLAIAFHGSTFWDE
jgi:hypothetical protein